MKHLSCWLSLPAAIVAIAMAMVLSMSQAMADPNATLDRIKASGVLTFFVMVGEEPGYIKDPVTGEWSGTCRAW